MMQLIFSFNKKVKSVINAHSSIFNKKGQFKKRIKRRHRAFWNTDNAEKVRNMQMSASCPIEKWKDVENWQRKLSNKYNSREFAKKHDCKVPELYWKGRDVETINFDTLPQYYVIRPTMGHCCNDVFLMSNSINLMDKQVYTKEDIKSILSEALTKNTSLEFLIEEFVRTEEGEYKIPDDYKFYMFNGEVARILLINRLSPKEGFINYYDQNWNLLPNICDQYSEGTYQHPPDCLLEMIEHAKRLSKTYEIFVRIDFYATDKGPVFGEFTPTPGLGHGFSAQGDKVLSGYWDKYCKGKI